jgi:septum formation protein
MSTKKVLVLASKSPRRTELLTSVGVEHIVHPADIDESPLPNEEPVLYVQRISREKAHAVQSRVQPDAIILAADTTVDVDGVIFGQPVDIDHARAMLMQLSGRTHQVHTGVTVLSGNGEHCQVVSSEVTFLALTPELLDWYLATGESVGKAGAYAIQGHGAALVQASLGSMSNIIGLPLDETLLLLAAAAE